MSKFCTTCGTPLDDNATFCTNCGTPQGQRAAAVPTPGAPAPTAGAAPAQGGTPATAAASAMKDKLANVDFSGFKGALSKDRIKKGDKYSIILLSCIGVVAIALIIILLVILLGGGYKKPVSKLASAIESGKGSEVVDLLTKGEQEYYEDQYVKDSSKYDSLDEYFDAKIEKYIEKLEEEYGDDVSISVRIADEAEVSESALKTYKKRYKERYDEKVDVTAGYDLLVGIDWKGKDDKDEGMTTVTVLKVDGDWRLYNLEIGCLIPSKLGGSATAGVDADEVADASKKAKDKLSDIDDIDDLDDIDIDDLQDMLGL
ncbi:MAG: zinc ribbon domain-containing protein [Ruminococcus sp.]|nr:zinc ribbon domain-containing protein [Ruminococcus sp.]